jgi:hypothetical protein
MVASLGRRWIVVLTPQGPSLADRKQEQARRFGESVGNAMNGMAAGMAARRAAEAQAEQEMMINDPVQYELKHDLISALADFKKAGEKKKKESCKASGKGSLWSFDTVYEVKVSGTCGEKEVHYDFTAFMAYERSAARVSELANNLPPGTKTNEVDMFTDVMRKRGLLVK